MILNPWQKQRNDGLDASIEDYTYSDSMFKVSILLSTAGMLSSSETIKSNGGLLLCYCVLKGERRGIMTQHELRVCNINAIRIKTLRPLPKRDGDSDICMTTNLQMIGNTALFSCSDKVAFLSSRRISPVGVLKNCAVWSSLIDRQPTTAEFDTEILVSKRKRNSTSSSIATSNTAWTTSSIVKIKGVP